MCGIAGVLGTADGSLVADLAATLRHRGPDGAGFHRGDGPHLASRRLAVVDLAGGAQPMYDERGRVCVVANGEIYNHVALRRRLEAAGHRFTSRSDVEVIAHLYEEYGDRCVEHLDGMFAFAVADGDRLLLARDPYGIKPLYYTVLPGAGLVMFASEIKALLRRPELTPALDAQALADSMVLGYPVDDRTLIDGVRSLPPGHLLTATGHHDVRISPYRPATAAPDPVPTFDEAQEHLWTGLRAAVTSHLAADVEVALMLSGGLDSALLAVLAREVTGSGPRTFAVADRPKYPDAVQAARIAVELGCRHETVVMTFDDYLAAIPGCLHALEHPHGWYGTPLYVLSARIGRDFKVCLSGEGADELFGGYAEYLDPGRRAYQMRQRLAAIAALGLSPSPRAAEIVDNTSRRQPVSRYLRQIFADNMREQLVGMHLEPLDKAGMSAGVEIRVPYLDRSVAALVASLPVEYRVQPALSIQKYLLKRLVLGRYPHLGPVVDAALRRKVGAPGAGWRHQQALSRLCETTLPDRYRTTHEFGACFPDKVGLVMFDLFREILLAGRGAPPDGLSLVDFIEERAGCRPGAVLAAVAARGA
jgi:asparagine synthase (glutamine-hydrolysing)